MKTIILDFDGTIADTQNSIVQTVQTVLDELGMERANESDIKKLTGLPLKDTFLKAAHITEDNILERAVKLYREKYNSIALNTVELFPNVKEVLKELHGKGVIITVASSKGKEALLILLNRLEIARYITLVFGEQDVKNRKPAPDMANLILKATESLPHETLVAGDTIYDIAMGQGANCITCGVTYGNHTAAELKKQKADYIIDDFADIMNIL